MTHPSGHLITLHNEMFPSLRDVQIYQLCERPHLKRGEKRNVHRPELQHCSNFMWKYKDHQGLRALSHQILGHGLQGSFSFRSTVLSIDSLQLSGHFTSPHSYCLKLSAGSHKDYSYVPGWAPRYLCTPSFGGT